MAKIKNYSAETRGVAQVVGSLYGLDFEQMISINRRRELVDARKIMSVLLRNVYKLTFSKIGAILQRDHTTMLHYYRDHENLMETDRDYKHFYNTALSAVGHLDKSKDLIEDVTFIEGLLERVDQLEREKEIWKKKEEQLANLLQLKTY